MHNKKIMNNSLFNHKIGIAQRFSRAAANYDQYASFQRTCGNKLYTFASSPIKGQRILDAGCGTGWFSRIWQTLGNQVIALDISAAMLFFAKQQQSAENYIIGDIEQLPLANKSIDLIYSNLAVQWCDNLSKALANLYRVLRPRGILALSTLAYGSLAELAQAWKQVDDRVHINHFLSKQEIADAFAPYRHHLWTESYLLHYQQLSDLLREIKGVGASYLYSGRTSGLTTRSHLRALEANWPHQSAGLPLSYYVVYGVIYRD